jgi:hypothetical protein
MPPRGDVRRDDDGPTVVRAVVQARLLGIKLLVLDARVVIGHPEDTDYALPARETYPSTPRRDDVALTGVNGAARGAGDGVALAMQLLGESSRSLEQSRRARVAL